MRVEDVLKAKIVHLILTGKPEEALKILGEYYHVSVPELRVGMPKGHLKDAGCYVAEKETIYVSDRVNMYNPYILLHEFYHHLRVVDGRHRGSEKYADKFAREYVEAYRNLLYS